MLGLTIMLVGVVFMLYGLYWALTTEYVKANIRVLVSRGFVAIIVGVIVLINGVVMQGYRNYYALTIHLRTYLTPLRFGAYSTWDIKPLHQLTRKNTSCQHSSTG
ncbi:MAG: hypothetical protein ACUVT5_01455 [Candidatus Bathyarchaeales archaeon]